MKLFFFDLETTGTLYWKHGIHQIAGKIVIDGKEKERFNWKVRPNPKALIEPKALEVGGVTEEQIMVYPEMETVFKECITMMGKYVNKYQKPSNRFHMVGFNNTQFDNAFLKAWFAQNGESYFYSWFWYDSLDVMTMAAQRFAKTRHTLTSGFKLKDVSSYLGIKLEEDKLHDAMYDIDLTEQCFNKLYKEDGYTWEEMHEKLEIEDLINKQVANPTLIEFENRIAYYG